MSAAVMSQTQESCWQKIPIWKPMQEAWRSSFWNEKLYSRVFRRTLRVKFTGKLTDYAVYAESDSGNLSFGGKEYPGYQEGVFGNSQARKT